MSPTSKGEVEIRDRVLLGIWEDIKADFNSEVINGNPYTASRYVYNLAIEIGSLFYGAGELKAAAGVKKADNVIDGLRAIDKVSDAKKLSNGELWFNYFNKVYGAENVEWTSKVFEGNAGLRERVFANIEMSKVARESSNYSDFAKFEKKLVTEGASKGSTKISAEMEKKILEGKRKAPNKNEVIGGHSSNINNTNDIFATEEVSVNPDGTKNIKFIKNLKDGNISKIKKSTIFPDSWSESKIISSIKEVGDSPVISVRERDGATWHRQIIDGVEIDVIKINEDVVSGYPTGKVNAPKPSGFK